MSTHQHKKSLLLILDGWGIGINKAADAIYQAKTPNMDRYMEQYPHNILITHGNEVGLPIGQMGNSEVGHLNIGAGRIVYQELQRINQAIQNQALKNNQVLNDIFEKAVQSKRPLHLMGILSDGGVHGHIDHLKALISYALEAGVQQVNIHAFTDGRDTDPQKGVEYVEDLLNFIQEKPVKLVSVIGRYYAMDRDKRWDRVAVAYNALVKGEGQEVNNFIEAIKHSYQEGITDEFLMPLIAAHTDGAPFEYIQPNDAVIVYNFRTDRCREIVQVLSQFEIPEFNLVPLPLNLATMTEYDHEFRHVQVIFNSNDLSLTLGEVISKHQRSQLRIAETEKYPHVTFFFSGGREEPFEGEERILIPSPKDVPTYDLKPEMGAYGIKDAVIKSMSEKKHDFICLNFANADMVGHTGNFKAAIKACEVVDECVGAIVPHALEEGYGIFIIADHGNSDYMFNEDGSPFTAHTLNDVPFIFIAPEGEDQVYEIEKGKLGDLAPTILNFMDIEVPKEMTGNNLLRKIH